jgi:amino acid adenylation domain-containing protein
LHHAFTLIAERHPTREAVRWAGGALTYAELEARSNQLARLLAEHHGVRRGDLVGVALPRTGELLVALLAILKSGAGYVPLDPTYPAERLDFMAKDSGRRLTVTTSAIATRLNGDVVCLDRDGATINRQSAASLPCGPAPDDLAYVIYTSGSTGRPKGVAVEHASVVALVDWAGETFSETELGGLLAATSVCFDLSVFELFAPLCLGGRVLLADDALALEAVPFRDDVRLINTVPSVMRDLLAAGAVPAGVQTVCLAGEPFPASLAADLKAAGVPRVVNLYGPTEDTVYSTWTDVGDEPGAPSIGRPLPGTRVYILDEAGARCPAGVEGEIYLAGVGLARGYLGRPDLTAEKFVPDPFGEVPGGRLYRTGDRGVERADGQFECLGRLDHQVKIRGRRIELGEIEEALRRQAGVQDCAVAAIEGPDGDQMLVAYVCGDAGETELRRSLDIVLPSWMVPAAFVALPALPRTPNGKLERKALPRPHLSRTAAYRAPRTDLQATVCRLFAEITGADQVGVDDNFFDLGGHSLSAMRLTAQLRQETGLGLQVRTVFERPTPETLAQALTEAKPDVPPPTPGLGDRPDGRVALSSGQLTLWALDQIEGRNDSYNMPFAMRIEGVLDRAALAGALADVIARHPPLRTVVETIDGEPQGRVLPAPEPASALPFEQLARPGDRDAEARLMDRVRQEASRPFDMSADHMLRGRLFGLGPDEHILVLVMHHAAGDDPSTTILMQELASLYLARHDGAPAVLTEPAVRYADYAAWRRAYIESEEALEPQIAYWRTQLGGAPELLNLPTDRPRTSDRSRAAGEMSVELEPDLCSRLEAHARRRGATLFAVLLAGYAALLGRLSGQSDVVIGAPFADRRRTETEPLIGYLLNTLPLRVDLSGEPDAGALIDRCRDLAVQALANSDVPFERIVDELGVPRVRTHSLLFQAGLTWQSDAPKSFSAPGLDVTALAVAPSRSKFDLTLNLIHQPDGAVAGFIEYDASLFDEATIARWSGYLMRTFEALASCADPSEPLNGRPVAQLPILDDAETRLVLEGFNDTAEPTPDSTLVELFEAQARLTPDAVALTFGGRVLTYAELDRASNRLARHLVARCGPGPEQRIGIALERSFDMVIALLAVLKSGAAYLPLDPAYPPARLSFMTSDASPAIIVTKASVASRFGGETPLLVLDDPLVAEALERTDGHPLADAERLAPLVPDALAYILYTSGSTGTPKGVLTTHSNVVSLAWRPGYLPVGPENTLLQYAPLAFDAATFEIWGALLNGARLAIAPPGAPDLDQLAEVVADEKVDTLWLTASLFLEVVESRPRLLEPVKRLIAGGEALPAQAVRRVMALYPDLELFNGYGPTETTTFACTRRITTADADRGRIPVGAPIRNMRAYVLDSSLAPAPFGVPGELYLAGPGLARGYLGRPELTAERFVTCPLVAPGERVYRTGDLMRWRPDGALDFLGRIDDQIKIRGFRVEPGEIEASLLKIDGVGQAIVTPRQIAGEIRLTAYVAPAAGRALPDRTSLRAALSAQLPEPMIPAVFIGLESMPLTANGKLDRRALPDPEPHWRGRTDGAASERAPSLLEGQLAEIFRVVLGREAVGLTDSFFELGGHSLMGVRLMAEIEKRLGRRLPLGALYAAPSAEALAALLEGDAVPDTRGSLVPLQTEVCGEPVFIVHWLARDLARHLGPHRPVYGLALQGANDADSGPDCDPNDLRQVAAHYIEQMRAAQPQGPYHLLGQSVGGVISYEMARQLRAQGEKVGLLALLDAYVPSMAFAAEPLPLRSQIANVLRTPTPRLMRSLRLLLLRRLRKAWPSGASLFTGVADQAAHTHIAAEELLAGYEPEPYAGDVLFFESLDTSVSIRSKPLPPSHLGWTGLVGGRLDVCAIPGTHENIVSDPQAGLVAAEIVARLDPGRPSSTLAETVAEGIAG